MHLETCLQMLINVNKYADSEFRTKNFLIRITMVVHKLYKEGRIYSIDLSYIIGAECEATETEGLVYLYEPFGLGRFATDHSLTKAASRSLFVRVRRYAPQTITPTRPCLSVIISAHK